MKLDSGFHKWAFSKGMHVRIDRGEYSNSETRTQYECWKAARAEAFKDAIEAVRDAGGDNEDYHAAAIEARAKETQ